ncbi:hypothetical protein [Alicyclobacillus acidoterrestris]|uniref:Uncharacterized protein n=1 Tax=Alicyclobacillus acidoterrestris (strain ATCC 49025 / DSM 3922 / CIP 106132 / NCIMB 13137 / GD3B) TaxID=1356854 RepID=T0BP78_ALIAG|nr:hypothetical protein [Alicyclobacillus acidoterrestris]EPZ42529.1 hypothetical protein N007_01745 [Alicyclobacillus acidoterrestris ATCC 49025]UNO49459.1 hypothetical protein K1I37_02595 [Alicyclobacillus acidoterrestris]
MTSRPRRTRKKALKHGDLFHVYIASDTPPEVCEFLTELKLNGDFSYEVLQIIGKHVASLQQSQATAQQPVKSTVETTAAANVVEVKKPAEVAEEAVRDDAVHSVSPSSVPPVTATPTVVTRTTVEMEAKPVAETEKPVEAPRPSVADVQPKPQVQVEKKPGVAPKLDPIALLRQQRRAWVATSSSR